MTIEKIDIALLVEDEDLYPRHSVDRAHVLDLMRAIAADEALPPPVIDQKTKKIIDGWHRIRAYRRLYGDTCIIDVDMRTYRSEVEMLKAAVQLNAAHGRKLDQQDRTRSVLLLKRRNVSEKQIAVVLHTTQERVQQLSLRFALVKNNGSSEPMPVKPILFRKPDQPPRTLTPEQYEIARGSSGLRTSQTLAQLHNELEVGLWDLTDRNLCERALRLAELIIERVPRIEEDAATA